MSRKSLLSFLDVLNATWSGERFDWDNLWVCFGVRLLLVVVGVVVWMDAGGGDLCGMLLGGTRLINKMCKTDATTRDGICLFSNRKPTMLLPMISSTVQYPIKPPLSAFSLSSSANYTLDAFFQRHTADSSRGTPLLRLLRSSTSLRCTLLFQRPRTGRNFYCLLFLRRI